MSQVLQEHRFEYSQQFQKKPKYKYLKKPSVLKQIKRMKCNKYVCIPKYKYVYYVNKCKN